MCASHSVSWPIRSGIMSGMQLVADVPARVKFCILQVTYPKWLGRVMHSAPLPLALAAAWLRAPCAKSGAAAPGRAAAVARGAALWLAAVAACFALPASIGAARAYLTGAA